MFRTLLHVATDWPGHWPNGAAIVDTLIGADIAARCMGHTRRRRFIGRRAAMMWRYSTRYSLLAPILPHRAR